MAIEDKVPKYQLYDLEDKVKMMTPIQDFSELKWKMMDYKLLEEANQDKNNIIDMIKEVKT